MAKAKQDRRTTLDDQGDAKSLADLATAAALIGPAAQRLQATIVRLENELENSAEALSEAEKTRERALIELTTEHARATHAASKEHAAELAKQKAEHARELKEQALELRRANDALEAKLGTVEGKLSSAIASAASAQVSHDKEVAALRQQIANLERIRAAVQAELGR